MNREKIEKPWGSFDRFTLNELSTVKILKIKKGEGLSLQTHKNRNEFWRILSGYPMVTVGVSIINASPEDEFMIKVGEAHRIDAIVDDVEVLEIALGNFDETDINRLEDKYGRV